MAGTIRGKIDCLSNAPGANTYIQTARNSQELYTNIYNFLLNHPNVTRIADGYGVAASSGNIAPTTNTRGIGYWDQSVNFGNQAFSVWRFNNALHPYLFFIELTDGLGATVPNSGRLYSGTTDAGISTVWMAAAWGFDSNGSASTVGLWNGTTNNDGTDTRGTVRWSSPGGGLHVLSRANSTYGDFATNRNSSISMNYCYYYEALGNGLAYNILADDDSIMILTDHTNNNTWNFTGVVRYSPFSGYSNINNPYVMFGTNNSTGNIPFTVTFGETTGGNGNPGGGIIVPTTANGGACVRPFFIDRYPNAIGNATYQPSNVDGYTKYIESDLLCMANAPSETTSCVGPAGRLDTSMIREIYNTGSADTNTSLSRAFFGGSTSLTTIKVSVPWDSTTSPRTYANGRTGVTF